MGVTCKGKGGMGASWSLQPSHELSSITSQRRSEAGEFGVSLTRNCVPFMGGSWQQGWEAWVLWREGRGRQ